MANQEMNLSKRAILAMAILAACEADPGGTEIRDISRYLHRLTTEAGVALEDIALRKIPGGFYSEDIETLVGQFLAAGYAQQRSPLQIGAGGKRILRKILQKELETHSDAALKAAEAIGFSLNNSDVATI